ncbi:hypothetical protein ACFZAG_01605 [Streptomyces sp. NPDC012403]|uniref:hypothetical protein n=1 Tax=unclassified Streptomyces TaxID=2593676 RepID=UPI0036ED6542
MGRIVMLLAGEPGIGGTDAFALDGNAQDLRTGKDGGEKISVRGNPSPGGGH